MPPRRALRSLSWCNPARQPVHRPTKCAYCSPHLYRPQPPCDAVDQRKTRRPNRDDRPGVALLALSLGSSCLLVADYRVDLRPTELAPQVSRLRFPDIPCGSPYNLARLWHDFFAPDSRQGTLWSRLVGVPR